jgi:hypothetical protein
VLVNWGTARELQEIATALAPRPRAGEVALAPAAVAGKGHMQAHRAAQRNFCAEGTSLCSIPRFAHVHLPRFKIRRGEETLQPGTLPVFPRTVN